MTADLVAFLRARLDDTARKAKAATAGPWWHNPRKQWLGPEEFERYDRTKGEEFVGYGGPHPFTGCVAATGPADDPRSMADAAHIAEHDPARVLAEVDAKRRILDECAKVTAQDDWEYTDAPELAEVTLMMLALPYRDHSDYLERWFLEP